MVTPAAIEPSSGPRRREDKTVGELFSELAGEIGTLVRQEIQLATTEMGDKAGQAARQLGYVLFGAVLGVAALLTLLAALVLVLAMVMELWQSALLVGLVAAVAALVVTWKGAAALRDMSLVPRQTLATIRENRDWARHQLQ